MGFSRQENWAGLPFPSPVDLPDPGIELMSPALAGGFFTTESPGKSTGANRVPHICHVTHLTAQTDSSTYMHTHTHMKQNLAMLQEGVHCSENQEQSF